MARLGRSKMVYYVCRLAGALVPHLPPRAGFAASSGVGVMVHALHAGARSNVRSHMRHIRGPSATDGQINRLVRATFGHLAHNYYDLFRLPILTDAQVNAIVQVHGWENVQIALSLGRGLIITSAHMGCPEIVLCAMLLRGVDITAPVERVEPAELFDYLTALRTRKGIRLIPVDGLMTGIFRTLHRGGVVCIASDRNAAGEGTLVSFFGAPARLPDGHVRLAMRTGAPMVFGVARRVLRDRYEASFHPRFVIPEDGSQRERYAAGMSYVVNELQEAIGAYPEQWACTVPVWADENGA